MRALINGTSVQIIIVMIVMLHRFCGIFSSGVSSLDVVIVLFAKYKLLAKTRLKAGQFRNTNGLF